MPPKSVVQSRSREPVVRKLIDVAQMKRSDPRRPVCICGSVSCAEASTSSAFGEAIVVSPPRRSPQDDAQQQRGDDTSEFLADVAASLYEVPVCNCVSSAQRTLPQLLWQSLGTLLPHGATIESSAARLSFRLPWVRSMWPAAMGGHDVLLDASRTWMDSLHDAVIPQLAHLATEPQTPGASTSVLECASFEDTSSPAASSAPELQVSYSCIGKLDAWLGILWSLMLHVTKQPMLDHHNGPTALVLCATQRQCDEAAYLLAPLATLLQLVVHNTFDPLPLMPPERRADVVVSTPLHFLNLCGGLGISDAPPPPHLSLLSAHAAARSSLGLSTIPLGGAVASILKPYTLECVAQIALMDADGIRDLGMGPLLDRMLLGCKGSGGLVSGTCQWYMAAASAEGAQWCAALRASHTKGKNSQPLVVVRLWEPLLYPSPPAAESEPTLKRLRTESLKTPIEPPLSCSESSSSCLDYPVLLVTGILSVSQIHMELEIVADVKETVTQLALDFAAQVKVEPADLQVRVRLILLGSCSMLPSGDERSSDARCRLAVYVDLPFVSCHTGPPNLDTYRAILGSVATALDGTLFDGNVVNAWVVTSAGPRFDPDDASCDGAATAELLMSLEVKASLVRANKLLGSSSRRCALWNLSVLGDVSKWLGCVHQNRSDMQRLLFVKYRTSISARHGVVDESIFPKAWFVVPPELSAPASSWWSCASDAVDGVLVGGQCVIVIRGVARSEVEATSRKIISDHRRSEVRQPSQLECFLQECENHCAVKGYLMHVDTKTDEVSIFLELWSRTAAVALYLQLREQKACCTVEWFPPHVLYECASRDESSRPHSENSSNNDHVAELLSLCDGAVELMPHPLDR